MPLHKHIEIEALEMWLEGSIGMTLIGVGMLLMLDYAFMPDDEDTTLFHHAYIDNLSVKFFVIDHIVTGYTTDKVVECV